MHAIKLFFTITTCTVLLLTTFGCSSNSGNDDSASLAQSSCAFLVEKQFRGKTFSLSTPFGLTLKDNNNEAAVERIHYAVEKGQTFRFTHSSSAQISATLYGPNQEKLGELTQGAVLTLQSEESGTYNLELKNSGTTTPLFLVPDPCRTNDIQSAQRRKALSIDTPGVYMEGITLTSVPTIAPNLNPVTVIVGTLEDSSYQYFNKALFLNTVTNVSSYLSEADQATRLGQAVRTYLSTSNSAVYVIAVEGDESAPSLSSLIGAMDAIDISTTASTLTFSDIPAMSGEDVAALYSNAIDVARTAALLVVGGLPLEITSAPEAAQYVTQTLTPSPFLALYYPQNGDPTATVPSFDIGILVAATQAKSGSVLTRAAQRIGTLNTVDGYTGPILDPSMYPILTGASINQIVQSSPSTFELQGDLLSTTLSEDFPTISTVEQQKITNYIAKGIVMHLNQYVFSPNDPLTWSIITEALSAFLESVYQVGALAGNGGSSSFVVSCGLPSTMTGLDVLNGYLIVSVQYALTTPGSFDILTIRQTIQTS